MDQLKENLLKILNRPEILLWTAGAMVFFCIVAVLEVVFQSNDVPITETPTITATQVYPTLRVATFTPAPTLVLPTPSAVPVTDIPAPTPVRTITATHVVVSGDTLLGIAVDYGVTVEAIKIANGKADDLVYEGEELLIPVPETVPTNTPLAPGTGKVHIVAEGDTLGGVALEYDVTIEAILAANNLDADDFITVGQELVIPSSNN